MIDAGLLDASVFGVGKGDLRFGAGYDTQLGLLGELELRHRFFPWLYGFAEGQIRAGPRIEKLHGRALIGLGGEW